LIVIVVLAPPTAPFLSKPFMIKLLPETVENVQAYDTFPVTVAAIDTLTWKLAAPFAAPPIFAADTDTISPPV